MKSIQVALTAIGLSTVLLAGGPAFAERPDDATTHAAKMMPRIDHWLATHPRDPQALYAKSQASLALGDKAATAQAYRILAEIFPDNPRIRLELAALEHDLRNFEAARDGYSRVAARSDLPQNVRKTIDARLSAIHEQTRVHNFWGNVTLGLRAQENANGGPDNNLVDIWGLSFVMDDASMPRSDVTGTLSGRFGYSYRLNDQGDTLGASASLYTALPSKIDDNRRDVGELRFGPSFNLERWGYQGRLNAQVFGTHSRSADQRHFESIGVSISSQITLDPRNILSVSLGHRDEDHIPNERRSKADDRDNLRNEIALGWQHLLRPDLMVIMNLSHENRSAKAGWHSTNAQSASLGLAKRYAAPVAWSKGQWTSGMRVTATRRRHDAPDPMISLTRAERATLLQLDLEQVIPINDKLIANIGVTTLKARSNYDTSVWSDTSLNLSLSYSF